MKRQSFLLDGPIMLTPERREGFVTDMAARLLESGAFPDRGRSIKQLTNDGYWTVEVLLLVDDARQVAMQHIVAVEMADS